MIDERVKQFGKSDILEDDANDVYTRIAQKIMIV